ncbi:hypothetical protein GYMLUDRAFT_236298 [Collybiopsis luxurians FD-317 M1]|nr:hypothetical protein GYMLUDRAFT_236298 [Collybiopsis luxurians FD-317 M1]
MPSTIKSKPVGTLKSPPKRIPSSSDQSVKEIVSVSEDSDLDSEDDGGIDKEGMERLMKALGDDGLDEFDQAQLLAALGEDEVNENEDSDEEGEEEAEDSGESGDEVERNEESNEEQDTFGQDETQLVQLEDVEVVMDDAVPVQKVEINNEVALARIRESMQLDPSLPWTETLAVSYPHTIDIDVNDDLNRELAFYKQALHSATHARQLVAKSYPNFPWTRPNDYFAEMVKSDVHMERIRQRLLDEKAMIKKSEDKRKEREGKKFGKQVQIEKIKERERGKKEMEERLKGLKRKRKDMLEKPDGNDDAFDVAVEDAVSDRPSKRGRGGPAPSRQNRDKKYGFGGAGRRSKQNTRSSTDDFDVGSRKGAGGRGGFRGRGGAKGVPKRPGKSKRMAARNK